MDADFTEKSSTMQVLNRLKMELSNQEYYTDEQYIQFYTIEKFIWSVITQKYWHQKRDIVKLRHEKVS